VRGNFEPAVVICFNLVVVLAHAALVGILVRLRRRRPVNFYTGTTHVL
jgi:hypothetical protein